MVIFDGKDLSRWVVKDPARTWEVKDGLLTVRPGTGDLHTKDSFGDIQLHMEWRIPADVTGGGESRGNSGIKLHEAYEVQILDSYGAKESVDRISGAVYKQHAPLVNAARKAGQWQSYDIVFRAPRFDDKGALQRNGTLTVLHNGVLVQDRAKIFGRTNSSAPVSPAYRQPFFLQDHGSAVSFRNIWARELAPLADDQ